MKILAVSDEESPYFWDYYTPGKLDPYDLILSSGDLKADYLSFLVTMARCPVLYVHGNHDTGYDRYPPEGCDCVEDKLVVCKGLRILGLGGCSRYKEGPHQYTEVQMRRRIRKLRRAVKAAGGVDVVLCHASPLGLGDAPDRTHKGFAAFLDLLDTYHPQYLLHGHVHLNYGRMIPRQNQYGNTKIINCCGYVELECEGQGKDFPKNKRTRPRYENMDAWR